MNPIHNLNDTDFIRQFESGVIALSDWDHRGHVRYAWIVLEDEPRFERAMDRIRSGLKAHLGRVIEAGESPEFGYHETITRFWLTLVDHARRTDPGHADSNSFCDAHTELLDKRLVIRHYSKALLRRDESRHGFVEPDLAPFVSAAD